MITIAQITLPEVKTLVEITCAAIGLGAGVLVILDRIYRRVGDHDKHTRPEQSVRCEYDHRGIASSHQNTLEALKEMAVSNTEIRRALVALIESLRSQHEIQAARHQQLLAFMDDIRPRNNNTQ